MHPSVSVHWLLCLQGHKQEAHPMFWVQTAYTNTHAHIPRVVHLIPAGGHRGSWSGPLSPAGCFTDLSTWFHPLSKLGSLKTSTFMPQERPGFGESTVWTSALAVGEWFVSGENSRSVTQTLSRKLFWQEMSSWHLNALPRLTLDQHSLKNSDGGWRKSRSQNSGFGIHNLLKTLTQDQCCESDWNHTKSVLILGSEGKLT